MNESSSPAAGQRKRIQADVVRRRHRRRRCEAGHHDDDDDDEMGIIWAVEGRERRSERRTSGFIMRDQAAAAWLVRRRFVVFSAALPGLVDVCARRQYRRPTKRPTDRTEQQQQQPAVWWMGERATSARWPPLPLPPPPPPPLSDREATRWCAPPGGIVIAYLHVRAEYGGPASRQASRQSGNPAMAAFFFLGQRRRRSTTTGEEVEVKEQDDDACTRDAVIIYWGWWGRRRLQTGGRVEFIDRGRLAGW